MLFNFDVDNFFENHHLIAGVDEVGRGPLAGPVVACAIIMPYDEEIQGVNDSKKLSAKKREFLNEKILEKAISVSIKEVSNERIDEINILEATKECMTSAIESLEVTPDIVLIDQVKLNLKVPSVSIVKGDATSYAIACASIVAKVHRDNLMKKFAEIYSVYDFENNKGYGTKKHIAGLLQNGKCPLHRESFIKNFK